MFPDWLTVVRGAGDLATGVISRLHQSGFPVICTEIARPSVVRRTVSFAQAAYSGRHTVEGVTAERVLSPAAALAMAPAGRLPLLIAPGDELIAALHPRILVDARMFKQDNAARLDQAELVLGLGPGFEGGRNCHAAIETHRGHYLGRIWWHRAAAADTGIPGATLGYRSERVLRAPASGVFQPLVDLGDHVDQGQRLGVVTTPDGTVPVLASLTGVIRGLVYPGLQVHRGMKIGDVDPRDDPAYLHTISEKSLAIGGAVLTAILVWLNQPS
ncbi:MAG: EF2563 family selenium-dependent molybdenum hydroxylase system protein [Chloroflexi bacterium]|nr:EF2563 family selenium-dependent molybdenum hydroxylase system protein [Chloroflexota bacterium]